MSKFFTIITATYNAEDALPRLLDSLAVQTYRNFEWVMQDGASNDRSVMIAESYEPVIPSMSIASEEDSGIYDAWNKALDHIKGEWVLFMGADDIFASPDSLEKIADFLNTVPQHVEFLACNVELIHKTGEYIKSLKPNTIPCESIKIGMPFPHQGLFQRGYVLKQNKFSSELKIVGDHDFLCRTLSPQNYQICPEQPVKMTVGGVSSSASGAITVAKERIYVIRKHYGVLYTYQGVWRLLKACIREGLSKIFNDQIVAQVADCYRTLVRETPVWRRITSESKKTKL